MKCALACVLVAGGLAPLAQAQALTTLRHAWRTGDPATFALSDDGTRLFLSEGAAVGVHDARVWPPRDRTRLARIPVDATIVRLVPDGERLWIAGGTDGLLVARPDDAGDAREVDRLEGAVCMDVCVIGERTAALFARQDASVLRLYDRAQEPLESIPLGAGLAYRVAATSSALFVAMGTGGVVRVTPAAPGASASSALDRGPGGAAAFPTSDSFELGAPRVRDVAIAGRSLYLAADAAGLGVIDLASPWSSATPVELHPAGPTGQASYACRVVADGQRVVVGTHIVPVAMLDGAPATAYGAIGFSGRPADVDAGSHEVGQDRTLDVFERDGATLERTRVQRLDGGFGDLVLDADLLWELRLGSGLHRHALAPPRHGPRAWTTVGFAGVDGPLSLVRDGVCLFGTDAMGSVNAGLLRVESGGVAVVPGSESIGSLGFAVGAQWLDEDAPHVEWVLGGYGFEWRLFRLDWSGSELAHRAWRVEPPLAPKPARDGRRLRGREFFTSARDGDLLLCGTHGTPYGLVGFSASALVRAARETPAGHALDVAPLFQVETHPGGDPGLCYGWRVDVFTDDAGRRVAALAAGLDANPESPTYTQPLLQLYQLQGSEAPSLLGSVVGPNPRGNLTAVRVAEVGERRLAYASDAGSGMHVFDVTDTLLPRHVSHWRAAPSAFDGAGEGALDLALERDPRDGRPWIYLAALRLGVVVIDGSHPEQSLEPSAVLPTPGLAYGLEVGRVGGERVLVVGDHQAGLRVYGAGAPQPPPSPPTHSE